MAPCYFFNEEEQKKLQNTLMNLHDEIEEKREGEEEEDKNWKAKVMIMREKLKERYTKVNSEIIDLIDEIISQVKEKNNKEEDDDVKLKKINCILKIHCEKALRSLKTRLDNKTCKGIEDEYMDNMENKYYESWRIINEVLSKKYNDDIKSNVDRVLELVLHVIGEREFGKERIMEMEKKLVRFKEAMDNFGSFVEEIHFEPVEGKGVKEKMMEICREALEVIFEDVSEWGFCYEFVVDDELMVYKEVIYTIYGILAAKEDQEEAKILRNVFDFVYSLIRFYAEEDEDEDEEEEEEEKRKSGWLHGFFKILAVFGKKVAGRWWR